MQVRKRSFQIELILTSMMKQYLHYLPFVCNLLLTVSLEAHTRSGGGGDFLPCPDHLSRLCLSKQKEIALPTILNYFI